MTGNGCSADIAQWLVFALDAGRYGLSLGTVERVVRAAQFTPLPLAPSAVVGVIDVEGQILPVFDLRRRFGLSRRPHTPADQFLIARTTRRRVVLLIDAALGVIERPATDMVASSELTGDLAHIRGVIPLEDGLVLIQDLEQFLSPDEAQALDQAMNAQATAHAG